MAITGGRRVLLFVGLVVTMLTGLALSLGYLIYCGLYSGETTDEYDVKLNEPTEIPLSPDLNPISIDVAVSYAIPKGKIPVDGAQYEGSFKNADQTLWSGQFGVTVRDRDSEREERRRKRAASHRVENVRRVVLETVDVEREGGFIFLIHEVHPPDIEVESIKVSIRRNVERTNIPLVVVGFTMFTAGLGGLIFFGVKTIMR